MAVMAGLDLLIGGVLDTLELIGPAMVLGAPLEPTPAPSLLSSFRPLSVPSAFVSASFRTAPPIAQPSS